MYIKSQWELQVTRLNTVLKKRDPETFSHSFRVACLTQGVCRVLSMPREQAYLLTTAALMHDVGKVKISDDILFCTTGLTDEEYFEMQAHSSIGAEMLAEVGFHPISIQCVRHHHEHWDGCGYPDGLAGKEIPIGSRIMALCDCIDAMCHARRYHAAQSEDCCKSELVRYAGIQFDPALVEIVLEHWDYILSDLCDGINGVGPQHKCHPTLPRIV